MDEPGFPNVLCRCVRHDDIERQAIANQQSGEWGFLTNDARVLLATARDTVTRIRDLAAVCHITERTAQRVVADLEQAGYLSREREGRRTRYTIHLDRRLRHPAEAHLPVRALLELVTGHGRRIIPGRAGEGQNGTLGDSQDRPRTGRFVTALPAQARNGRSRG
ncbi:MarR family protein [Streptomyces puniciscabiei]|uniref:MarR family protein n=1 Tax=Streptomyces puniciscabiei TaxID=164348 RepID=A0A542UIY6_9ACTN|nr:helix-turn-helix domain-containing protein [Streptomyces puniciscabiei]TQK99031.1 MarR family protein [Streptomyces puniciscabiei]